MLIAPDTQSLAGGIAFRAATRADDAGLRNLLRENEIPGAVSVTLEREPSFFHATEIEGDRHQLLVACDVNGEIIASGARASRVLFVNGQEQRVGYLGQLRIARAHRKRRGLLFEGYAALRQLRGDDGMPFDITSIMADNDVAMRLLTRGLRGLPRYAPIARVVTLVIPTRGRAKVEAARDIEIVPGSTESLPEIADCLQRNLRRFQFAPRWTSEDLRDPARCRGLIPGDFLLAQRGGQVVGCVAIWNQRAFKQVVVRGYSPWVRRLRPFLNAASPWLSVPHLPAPGMSLEHAFLSHVAIDGDDGRIFHSLVARARETAHMRGLSALLCGLTEGNPMLAGLRALFGKHALTNVLHSVDWGEGQAALAALDSRPVHVEVAVL
ncbi:MAG: hypothetical protein IT461_12830 [Planctomycetes bacterium]|nr:hypothetical protein [Planctomycetota bacterium]